MIMDMSAAINSKLLIRFCAFCMARDLTLGQVRKSSGKWQRIGGAHASRVLVLTSRQNNLFLYRARSLREAERKIRARQRARHVRSQTIAMVLELNSISPATN
jgi:hypothetical protein